MSDLNAGLRAVPEPNRNSCLDSYLETIQPELMVMTRLFGYTDEIWGNVPLFRFRAVEEGGQYRITFSDGEHQISGTADIPHDADPRIQELHQRRTARRLCKQTLYNLCREITGIHPPWGSMTGVRPTQLMLEALKEGLSEEDAVNRLISRFDVTRSKAELLAEVARVQRLLPASSDQDIDVYIGIPFCVTRCAYCSFSSGELGDGRLVQPYMDALAKECEACSALLRETGKRLRAVYVGGGTPTALPADAFERLMDLLLRCFPGALEYTVEAGRPDSLDHRKLSLIRQAGVQRISINPQTMNDRTLAVIGRAHTAQQTRDAYALARAEGFRQINMDVIAGLPGETEADFHRTMEAALELKPESLTVHTLALKRSSRMSLEKAPLPDGALTARMVSLGQATARQLGMVPYYLYRQKHMAGNQENTGYALPGLACLYNVDIMEETTHILALGAGGISKRIWPEEGHITRAPNVSNIQDYIQRISIMIERKQMLFSVC